MKFGFESEEEFKEKAKEKFSLVETGIVDQESSRLLLINVCFVIRLHPLPGSLDYLLTFAQGVNDGLMPIEDSMLLFNYGSPKEARYESLPFRNVCG